MQLLNERYYQELITKFGGNQNELHIPCTKFISINTNFLEKCLKERVNLFVQIPASYREKELLFTNLVIRLTEIQFLESESEPSYEVGMILKGMKFRRRTDLRLIKVKGDRYYLEEIVKGKKEPYYSPFVITTSYDELKDNYQIIKKGTRKERLIALSELFKTLFNIDFIPNSFRSKSIVICQKSMWNSLSQIEVLNSNLRALIPSTYFAKSGAEQSTINIDPALYFVPDYKTAFNSILTKNEKIDNIVLFDCKPHQIPRMIMDQKDFGYNLFGVTTQSIEGEGVKIWRWLKEEIEKINSL